MAGPIIPSGSANHSREHPRDEGDDWEKEPEPKVRKLGGQSLYKYSQRKIDDTNTLLGIRYLCRGGGSFIVAPSGHGKSVLTVQGAVQLACNKPMFGIANPNGPLKSLIIQS